MLLNDTFTAADGSLLTSHTADSGATYAMNPAGSGAVTIHSGRAHADADAFPYSSASAADCEIEGVFHCRSADGEYAGILGRMSTSAVAWYSLLLQFGGGVTLYGSSDLGSFAMSFEAGADYRTKLLMKGSLIRAFINGYEFKRVLDTDFATGRIGFCFGAASSESTGLHLDSLAARDESITPQILFHGDSLTSGQGVTALAHDDKYPTQSIALLESSSDWANLGISGRTLADLLANVAEVDNCRRPDAPSDIIVVWGGINDFAIGSASVGDVIDRLTTYAAGRRTLGFQVVGATIIAADEAHPNISPEFNGQRNEVNAWLRSNWPDHFDALADAAADARLSDPTDHTYYQTDGVHLAPAGAGVAAEIVAAAIESLTESTLTITEPMSGQILLAGEATTISWTTTGDVPTVRIDLSRDGGSTFETLVDDLDNSGSFEWTPSDSQASPTAHLRVTSTSDAITDESASFKIATTSPLSGTLTAEALDTALEELKSHGDATWGRNPILPVIARVNQDPVSKSTLVAYQRGRSAHQLVVVDSTGAGVNLSSKSLQFSLETLTGAAIASTASITIVGDDANIASFTASEQWHAQPGLYRYALRDLADGARVWARGDYLIEPTAGPV